MAPLRTAGCSKWWTKVNRCLYEVRRSLLERYAGVVREPHRSGEALRIVLPVGAVVAAAAHADPAGHVFVKVYETATTWLGERAASSFMRAPATWTSG